MGNREHAYNTLGLSRNADEAEIKKAYRKLAMQHHPDKGGDPAKFKDISNAYETLTKPEEPSMEESFFGGGAGVFHMGGHPFGGMPFGGMSFDAFGFSDAAGLKPKRKVVSNHVVVPLDKIATGVTKKFAIKQTNNCDACQRKCDRCGGKGLVMQTVEHMLGRQRIIQQHAVKCDACVEGYVTINHRCEVCAGKRTVEKTQEISIDVEKGAREGKKYVFDDTTPGTTYHFVLRYEKHPEFAVQHEDLVVKRTLSFADTLRDVVVRATHPCGQEVAFRTSEVASIVHTGVTHRVPGKGLVIGRGAMVFVFTVDKYPRLKPNASGCSCELTRSG